MYKRKKVTASYTAANHEDWKILTDEHGESITERFVWCLHCERAFDRSNARIIEELLNCAYSDCDGTLMDFRAWSSMREYQPDLPVEPEVSRIYPLYPE
jgi:hypothetical protein